MCHYSVMVERFGRIQGLITATVRAVIDVLGKDYLRLRSEHSLLSGYFVQADGKRKSLERNLSVLAMLSGHDTSSSLDLDSLRRQIDDCQKRASELNRTYDQIKASLDLVEKTAIKDDYLSSQWEGIRQNNLLPQESIGRLEVLCEEALQTVTRFKKDKQAKQLSYNEEQIHRMDKEKLGRKMGVAKKIYDELFGILKNLHNNFGTWHGTGSETRRFQDQLTSAQHRLEGLLYEYQKLISDLTQIEETINELIMGQATGSRSSAVSSPASREISPVADVTPSITASIPLMSESYRAPPQTSWRDVGATDTNNLMSSLQQLISDLPLDSLGMVPVPKPVKHALQHYEHSLLHFHHQLSGEGDISRKSAESRQT